MISVPTPFIPTSPFTTAFSTPRAAPPLPTPHLGSLPSLLPQTSTACPFQSSSALLVGAAVPSCPQLPVPLSIVNGRLNGLRDFGAVRLLGGVGRKDIAGVRQKGRNETAMGGLGIVGFKGPGEAFLSVFCRRLVRAALNQPLSCLSPSFTPSTLLLPPQSLLPQTPQIICLPPDARFLISLQQRLRYYLSLRRLSRRSNHPRSIHLPPDRHRRRPSKLPGRQFYPAEALVVTTCHSRLRTAPSRPLALPPHRRFPFFSQTPLAPRSPRGVRKARRRVQIPLLHRFPT
jgi:hypothetical protein